MANRIYIAIGVLAILFLGAGFVLPWFIDWNAYKGRMEQMTAEALGIEVSIAGDMEFSLLPQPRMRLNDVRIGPQTHPLGEARAVEADFSLMDFLRDRFTVTDLALVEPQLNLTVGADGRLETPITLAEQATASNVSIANARFMDGVVRISDLRSGEIWQAEGFSGEMRMSALRGPFVMQGRAVHDGAPYTVRLGTSAMNADGVMQVTAFLRPVNGRFSVSTEGLLHTGTAPSFAGRLIYRQSAERTGDAIVGDLVLESPLEANPSEILLNDFTLLPDEDHAATRLTGFASVALGAAPRFNAVISGGVVTLLPREVADNASARPFEIMRLLREMPQPPIPPLPGRLGMDISELGLRGIGLRDVRLDATTDGRLWTVEELSGRLAGDTLVKLTGSLGRAAGWPAFEGTLAASAGRLDSLTALWRRTPEGNPLFNMPGSLNGKVRLANDTLRLSEGLFVLDGTLHEVGAVVRFGEQPQLEVEAALSTLSAGQSAALLALLPPLDPGGAFGLSFPRGRLDLKAAGGTVLGQRFSDVALASRWEEDELIVEGVQIADFGGVAFEGSGVLAGTLAAPEVAGRGHLGVVRGARALDLVFGGAQAGHPLRRLALGNLPAELDIVLEPQGRGDVQSIRLEGQAGVAEIVLDIDVQGGIAALGQGSIGFNLEAFADSGAALMAQMGLAPVIAGEDGALLAVSAFGNPRGTLETELTMEGGGERIDFSGAMNVADLARITGQGRVSFLFEDTGALMDLAGAGGIHFPGVEGLAELGFVGTDSVTLSDIYAVAGESEVTGHLNYAAQSRSALVSGALDISALDIEVLGAMLGGPAALIRTPRAVWPDGPLDIGQGQRFARGRVAVTTPVILSRDAVLIEEAGFDYSWDAEEVRLRALTGRMGGGSVEIEAALCCAAQLADKSLSGRLRLEEVDLAALLPDIPAAVLRGRLTAGAQFNANGDSFQGLVDSLIGSGSFSVYDMEIERLSPDVFLAAAAIEDIIALEPEALEEIVREALDAGRFVAEDAGGLFSLVGGTVRVSNVAMDGARARLLGGGSLRLGDLAVASDWTLASTRNPGGNGLITETTGRIGINLAGRLAAPERRLDLSQMVDAIQMRAYEIELEELERLRAEQEARQRALAEEQARLMEEESRRQAEELLRQQREQAERLDAEEQQTLDEIGQQLGGQHEGSIFVLPPGALQLP